VLHDQFLRVRIPRTFELVRIGPAKCRAGLLQQIDLAGDGYPFRNSQSAEPGLEFIAALDLLCHARNITWKTYFCQSPRLGGPAFGISAPMEALGHARRSE
jgi:hypothetical protein